MRICIPEGMIVATKGELYQEGVTHFGKGELAQAEHTLKQAVTLDDRFALAYTALGMVYERMRKLDDAIACAKKVCELEPKDPLSFTSLSIYYMKKQMIPEAEKAQAEATRLGIIQQLKEKQGKGAAAGNQSRGPSVGG